MEPVRRDACAVCGSGHLDNVAELPKLPLTALFLPPDAPPVEVPVYDQALLYCAACGHGQLRDILPPEQLYGADYGFRTGQSANARRGVDWFVEGLPPRRFSCVLDVGCNDLHLLGELADRCDQRIGVDPLWRGREAEVATAGITVIGDTVEALDAAVLPARPDLVVCRHTLEHVPEPAALLARLAELAAPDALFVFEVPSLEPLAERLRFDQVFHQHLHYFSLASLLRLAQGAGLRPVAQRLNYHDWGALCVALERGDAGDLPPVPFEPRVLRRRRTRFAQQMGAVGRILEELADGAVVGYGAGQMLPVLAYHLGSDLRQLASVIDDDPAKEGWRYANLPLTIRRGPVPEGAAVVITAVDNAAPILGRLLSEDRPRRIVYPLAVL